MSIISTAFNTPINQVVCKKCGRLLPLENFNENSGGYFYFNSVCNRCRKHQQRKRNKVKTKQSLRNLLGVE